MSFRSIILKSVVIVLFLPLSLTAQLREFDVTPVQSGRIPVFSRHPDKAAIILNSSLTNLRFDSNLEIVEILGDATQGEYILIVNPVRQIISVSATGYQQGRVPVSLNQPRQVLYFNLEPKDRIITERGSLVVRTEPSGAMVSVDGIPGEFQTPYTFENLLAVTHSIRVRLDDYQIEERLVRVEANRPTIESIRLTPAFGFLLIREPDLELILKTPDDPQELRVSYTPGQPLRRPVGAYTYRFQKQFFIPFTDTVTVIGGRTTELTSRFEPSFSTLRVTTNVPGARLSSTDNRAPTSTNPRLIYLEQGQREVLVQADGYVPARLFIRSVAGASFDTTLTLLSSAEAGDLARREALPKGILQLAADVDADIYVNGTREGRMQTTLTLVPGRYQVEFRHAVKTERFSVDVPSADLVVRQVYLRPGKSTALTMAAMLPGSGHLYTKQKRGYGYLAAFAAGTAFAVMQNGVAADKTSEHDAAYRQYLAATTVADAALFKGRAEAARLDANRATTLMTYGIAAAAGMYVIQLADLGWTRPKYGYRSQSPAFELGLAPSGLQLTYRFP